MSVPSIIIIIQLGIIITASIAGGFRGFLKTTPNAEWAWVIVLIPVLIAEVFLILQDDHTLSGQMQWYVREHGLSGFFVVFWGWLTYHFVLEPVVIGVKSLVQTISQILGG